MNGDVEYTGGVRIGRRCAFVQESPSPTPPPALLKQCAALEDFLGGWCDMPAGVLLIDMVSLIARLLFTGSRWPAPFILAPTSYKFRSGLFACSLRNFFRILHTALRREETASSQRVKAAGSALNDEPDSVTGNFTG